MSKRSRQLALVVVFVAGLGKPMLGEQPAGQAGDAATKAPFELTVAEQAQVDRVLEAWERIDTFSSRFVSWSYDEVWGPKDKPKKEGAGEVRFIKPDKLLWRMDEPNPEQWIFDRQVVREFNFAKRMVIDHRVPAEMQSGRLWEGAMPFVVPFVFGDEPATLKERYWVRVATPEKQVGKFIHLELHPRSPMLSFIWCFRVACPTIDVIVTDPGLMPYAVQVRQPNGKQRTSYLFLDPKTDASTSEKISCGCDFADVPPGWKLVVDDPLPPYNGDPASATKPSKSQNAVRSPP